ncbi:MAG: DUF1294 domain-containing protein [Clostridiales bacterium]|nr:DUF1294 domain-containing protein [Clostridiales bacterium]
MENVIKCVVIGYLAAINLIGFTAMGIDKRKARKRKWRIPEVRLFILAAIGGSLGSWLGMYVFRHKTRHWYFVVGMPAILILQILLSFFILMIVG